MPKKLFERLTPDPEKIRNMKGLGCLANWLSKPTLWHIHRRNVATAFLIGLFWMSIPIPSQMLFAAICAILFRANLPISVVLVWISNPLTMPPIFYFNYWIGTKLLGLQTQADWAFEMSWDALITTLGDLWLPLYFGSAVVGLVLGILGYIFIRAFWRWHIIRSWRKRQLKHMVQAHS